MVTEPIQIDIEVLDLVRTYIPDVIGAQVGLPAGTSDHRATSIDVLEQTISQFVWSMQ